MTKILVELKKTDWILFLASFLLAAIGLILIYSSSFAKNDFLNFKKQTLFFIVGLFLMFFLSFFNWENLRTNSYLVLVFYLISLLLLSGLFFFAPTIRGVRSWYLLGPFSFDPIEFTKIVLIILLAKYFSLKHVEMYRIKHIILSGFYFLLPIVLIFFQPNLGSVLILICLWLGVLIISGIKIRHFLILLFCGVLVFIFSWNTLLKDYQKQRILSFIYPSDPLGLGWSQNQAKIAIGSGGIFGQGFKKGSQTQYGFLPEPQTDFTFAALAEEFGLLGVSVVFLLFLILFWRIMRIAFLAKNNFQRLFAIGFAIIILVQIFIHVGMNLGMLPIIGIPLPFLSYGGSNLIFLFIGLGMLQNLTKKLT